MASSRANSAPRRSTSSATQNGDVSGGEFYETTAVVVPLDGGYGWVIVAASFLSNFFIEGCNATFSVYVLPLQIAFDVPESAVALIGSMLVGIDQFSGPLASGITNRYGFRTALMTGGLVGATAFTLAHLSPKIGYLYAFYGLMGGIGSGLVYVPSVLAVNFYFTRWRALAVSLAMIGSNTGAAVLPHLIAFVLARYGWRKAMLVQAATMLCCTMLGLLFKPPRNTAQVQQVATPVSIASVSLRSDPQRHTSGGSNKNYPSVIEAAGGSASLITLATITRRPSQTNAAPVRSQPADTQRTLTQVAEETSHGGCARCLRAVFCCACPCRRRSPDGVRPMYRDDIFFEGSTVRLVQHEDHPTLGKRLYNMKVTRVASQLDILEELQHRCVMCPQALRRTLATMCDCKLLASPPMALVAVSFMLSSAAYYIPFTYLRLRELSKSGDDVRATMFLTVISVSAMAGRILTGVIASLPCANHFYMLSVVQTMGGLAVLSCAFDPPYEVQIACCVIYGFSLACTSNLRSLIIVDLVGLQSLTNAFGLVMLFQGVGFLSGPPLASMIKDASNSFPSVFYFAGALVLTSATLFYPLNTLRKRRAKQGDLVA